MTSVTEISMQTGTVRPWYPGQVFVTNTGSHYHAISSCGGLSNSRSARSVTFCTTCAERARAFMTWLGILVMPTRGQGSNPTLSNLMKLMVAVTLPALTAGEEMIKQVDPITRMGGYILLLMEIVSALMVLLLAVGLVIIGYNILKNLSTKEKADLPPPAPAPVTRHTRTSMMSMSSVTEISTQTEMVRPWYPGQVYVTNTGSHYHARPSCGGLSNSKSAGSVSFCATCAERARAFTI